MSSLSIYKPEPGLPEKLLLSVKAPAAETTDHYRRSAQAFTRWAASNGRSLTVQSFAEWIDWQRRKGVRAGKLRMDLYGGKAAIMWAAQEAGLSAKELAGMKIALDSIRVPKPPLPEIRTVDARERMMIIRELEPRMAYVARFMYATAARVSEAIGVRETDIVVERGVESVKVRLCGKGDKERWVRIPREMLAEINELHNYKGRIYLFEGSPGHPYCRQTITKAIRIAAGIILGKRITSHDLRHSRASDLFAKSKNLKGVSELLGHASVGTTARYYVKSSLSDKELFEGEEI